MDVRREGSIHEPPGEFYPARYVIDGGPPVKRKARAARLDVLPEVKE